MNPHLPWQAEFVAALLEMVVTADQVPRGFGGVEVAGCSSETLELRGGDIPKGEGTRTLRASRARCISDAAPRHAAAALVSDAGATASDALAAAAEPESREAAPLAPKVAVAATRAKRQATQHATQHATRQATQQAPRQAPREVEMPRVPQLTAERVATLKLRLSDPSAAEGAAPAAARQGSSSPRVSPTTVIAGARPRTKCEPPRLPRPSRQQAQHMLEKRAAQVASPAATTPLGMIFDRCTASCRPYRG